MKKRTLMERLLVRRSELNDPITRDYATVWACAKLLFYIAVLIGLVALCWYLL